MNVTLYCCPTLKRYRQSNYRSYLCFMQKSSPKSGLLYFLLSRKGKLMHYLHGFSLSTALSRLPETSSSPRLHIQHHLMGWHTNSLGGHFANYWMHFKPRDVFTRDASTHDPKVLFIWLLQTRLFRAQAPCPGPMKRRSQAQLARAQTQEWTWAGNKVDWSMDVF